MDEVDLAVTAGERVALMGANGSGKSTLLRVIGGLQRAQAGTVEVDEAAVTGRAAMRQTVWIPQRQSAGRFPLRVSELLESSGDPGTANEAAASLGLAALMRRPLGTLSGGQLQRAFIARAVGGIAAGGSLLLADEPTAALDFDGQAEIARLLSSLPVTVLVATHDRTVAAVCDRVLEMAAGQLREVS